MGAKAVDFAIHKGLLSQQSAYFKALFEGNFKEAELGIATLDDEDPAVFGRFHVWLYTGELLDNDETIGDVDYETLVDLFIFAEKRLAARFQNACIDAIISKSYVDQRIPHPTAVVGNVWASTSRLSPLRAFLVDIYARRGNMSAVLADDEDVEGYSKSFLASVIKAYYCMKRDQSTYRWYDFWMQRCTYHTHSVGEFCVPDQKKF